MKNTKKSFGQSFLTGLFFKNPAFSLYLGLAVAVLGTTMLENAFVIGILVLVNLVICNVLVSLLRKNLSKAEALVLTAILSAGLVTFEMILLKAFFPAIADSEALYKNTLVITFIPFLATSSLVLAKSEQALSNDPLTSLADSLGSGIGYLLALLLIALFREVLATGEISFTTGENVQLVIHLFDIKMSAFGKAFGGFFFLGIFAGLHNLILTKVEVCKTKALSKKEA
ncbi:MAG: Rnf-Nqr domain containing protein [Bacilli bacterium]